MTRAIAFLVAAWSVLSASIAAAQPNAIVLPSPQTSSNYRRQVDAITARAKQGDVDLLFLGDGITAGWSPEVWNRFYGNRKAMNGGIVADKTENLLWRLDQGNIDGINPKVTVILIGEANLGSIPSPPDPVRGVPRPASFDSGDKIGRGVKAVVDKVHEKLPETKILLMAIFPREDFPTSEVRGSTNRPNDAAETALRARRARMEAANQLIANLADEKTVFFLNINDKLSKEMMPGGRNLNALGYLAWAEAMEPKLKELLGEKADEVKPAQKSRVITPESVAESLAAATGARGRASTTPTPQNVRNSIPRGSTRTITVVDYLARLNAINARAKQGDVDLLFLGDEFTEQWATTGREVWDKYYGQRKAMNAGVAGDMTENLLWRLDQGNIDGITPKVTVILIGTHHEAITSDSKIADGIQAIVAKVRERLPATKVLLLAVFPRNDLAPAPARMPPPGPFRRGSLPDPEGLIQTERRRQAPDQANEIIAKLADNERIFFLDIGKKFLNSDGVPALDLMPNSFLLSAKGYQVWAEAMEPKLKELLGEPAEKPAEKNEKPAEKSDKAPEAKNL